MKRNEKCDCNSGKKFKKCCGKVRYTNLPQEPEKMTRADLEKMHQALGEAMPEEWKHLMNVMDRQQEERSQNELFEKLTGGLDPMIAAASAMLMSQDHKRHVLVQKDDPNLEEKVKEFFLHEAQGEKA